ncbi:hypothetical protein Dde_2462 [Oleidesulfovibrio alaskensis G20]|uniref:Uncharacterized protein n=1 Tax=Oleidesulfovibrio alaskensis (strain ATCC BAA-1058 / DSM 17464 / G20) TaxID=207559 RepID=Q30YI7_OLEA2|nr:hypothetical protein [Oleidesulfovibrio alaskensis]ABB39259.1 hypothetical protein Dde_2462 [Oleidesulfovibrio alaskensis G20]MBG0771986.1 hypothetical protein [Oleidesulfovibrio alaskensis]MBL3581776.1 hypothetical protein [Oleidesulfovibrio alaskensis]
MAEYTSEAVEVTPYFDVEMFMGVAQETRIGGQVMDRLVENWEKWCKELTVRRVKAGKIEYLVAWLSEAVENEVDAMWDTAPSDAHLFNSLAQAIVMATIQDVLPEVQDAGCAPAPKPTEALQDALEAEGIPYNLSVTALTRRYAVVTHHPFKGGCEICYLLPDCPKGNGDKSASTVVLPGYEPGSAD